MKRSLRRFCAASTATAVALVGALAMSTLSAETASANAAKPRPTAYGFNGSAYGTYVNTGSVGVTSGTTAYSWLGCTRRPGVSKRARVGRVNAPTIRNVINVGAVVSRSHTYKRRNGRVGMMSRNRIARVVIGNPRGFHVIINGLSTKSDAFAGPRGRLGARSQFNSAGIRANTGLPLVDKILNQAGATVDDLLRILTNRNGQIKIPGIGRLAIGRKANRIYPKRGFAVSNAVSLRVTLNGLDGAEGTADDVNAIIGRSRSRISRNVRQAAMRGGAHAIQGDLLDGTAKIGPLAERPLPCEGTRGKVKRTAVAGADLLKLGVLDAGVARARVYGVQRTKNGGSHAWTEGSIANVKLGVDNRALTIKGVVGRVNVWKGPRGRIARNIKGSRVLSIEFGGREYKVPPPRRKLRIGNLLEIDTMKRKVTPRGMKVIAVQVKVLDGSGAVLNLGVANAKLRRS